MDILFPALYAFTLATTLAALEIQVEGKNGWAKELPTWRPDEKLWYTRVFRKLSHGKILTGYHIIFFLLIFLIFHLPYAFGMPFTLDNEARVLSLMLLVMLLEDFIWFVINPHFGIQKFFSKDILWHQKRFLNFPPEYIFIFLSSFLVLLPNAYLTQNFDILYWWVGNILVNGLMLLIVILLVFLQNDILKNR